MTGGLDIATARALLEWHLELGADEPILDAPLDRFALPADAGAARPREARPSIPRPEPSRSDPARSDPARSDLTGQDPVQAARAAAAAAGDLEALRAAMAAYPHCELKRGARSTVFADGQAGARVMVIGEAPGRDEDLQGLPFVGRAGRLLDRMLGAIGLARTAPDPDRAVYITNVLPWRPPENRRPTAQECAMLLPFVERHVELAAPGVLVLMGNTPVQALLGETGILRLRGQWREVLGLPTLLMTHPAYLLRTPAAKRAAWGDLLELSHRLEAGR